MDTKVLLSLDKLIQEDIPGLMGKVGGVSGVFQMSSMLESGVEHTDLLSSKPKSRDAEEAARRRPAGKKAAKAGMDGRSIALIMLGLALFATLVALGVIVILRPQGVGVLEGRELLEAAKGLKGYVQMMGAKAVQRGKQEGDSGVGGEGEM